MPLAAPAIAAGWLLASTLPMVAFSAVRLGLTPKFYALATLLVAAVALVLPPPGGGCRTRRGGQNPAIIPAR